jgi:hypothetical protein
LIIKLLFWMIFCVINIYIMLGGVFPFIPVYRLIYLGSLLKKWCSLSMVIFRIIPLRNIFV